MIDISGLPKKSVILKLWEKSAQGMPPLSERQPTNLDLALAAEQEKLDYFCGRPMKVDLGSDKFDSTLYDRDHGDGAAQAAIDDLRAGNELRLTSSD